MSYRVSNMEPYWFVLIAGFVGNVVVSGNELSSTQPTGLGTPTMSFPYFHFQTELQQAYYFDEHYASTRMNLTDYINDWELSAVAPPGNPLWKPTRQHSWLSEFWAGRSFIWLPQLYGYDHHKKPDCNYTISSPTISWQASEAAVPHQLAFITFQFTLVETQSLDENAKKIIGGTDFELLGFTNHALGSCLSKDHFNYTYTISCRFPVGEDHMTSIAPASTLCMRLTVMLDQEHYDGYSEVLRTGNPDSPPIRVAVVNDTEFCGTVPPRPVPGQSIASSITADNKYSIEESIFRVSVPASASVHPILNSTEFTISRLNTGEGIIGQNVSIYTGFWVSKSAAPVSLAVGINNHITADVVAKYGFSCDDVSGSDLLLGRDNELPKPVLGRVSRKNNHLMARPPSSLVLANDLSRHESPDIKENYEPCYLMAVDYKNQSGRLVDFDHLRTTMGPTIPKVATTHSEHSLKYSFRPVTQVWSADRSRVDMYVSTYSQLPMLKAAGESNKYYVFMGASHMRYLFMFVMESLYGRKIVNNVDRKGTYFTMGNGRFVYQDSAYANYQVDMIKKICSETVTPGSEYTIIMQTGTWDMYTGSLRKFLRSPKSAQLLLTTISDMFEGRLACAHVTRLVWVTSMPFPICYDIVCDRLRGFRTSVGLQALNEFYLSSLLKMKMLPTKRLTIVDAFSIIQPRLGLSYNYESACDDHYSCIVQGYQGLYEMTYTPGGLATSQALLHALSSSDR
jgi:hypothetical protein